MKIMQLRKLRERKGPVLAYFDIEFNGLRINDFSLRVLGGELYVDVPKNKWQGNYWPVVEFENEGIRTGLLEMVHSYITDAKIPIEQSTSVEKREDKTDSVGTYLRVPLTKEEKIAISKRYHDDGILGSREDTIRMRSQHSDEMRRRKL